MNVLAVEFLHLTSYLLVTLFCQSYVTAYSGGAPDSACVSMQPGHGEAVSQSDPSPYSITVSSDSYKPGLSIDVTLSGPVFAGFLLTARLSSGETPAGTFSATASGVQLACLSTSVTHTNTRPKTSITVTWRAPAATSGGNVIFRATVVQSYSAFWTNVQSSIIIEVKPGMPQQGLSSTSPMPFEEVDASSCEKTKACLRVPDGCAGDVCDYLLTWKDADDAVSFELSASVETINYWVAFGLSKDDKMGDDSVIGCVYNSQTATVMIQDSWNKGYENEVLLNSQLGLVKESLSSSYINGRISCRFKRFKDVQEEGFDEDRGRASQADDTRFIYPLDNHRYFIFLAKGPSISGVKQKHTSKLESNAPVNITAFTSPTARNTSWKTVLIKMHGILMLSAWMVFASFAVLMPRYCKKAWPNKTCCDKKIWFQIHQSFMILALTLTAAAFVIIFVEAGEYVQLPSPTVAHAPLGIAVMTLVLINPIMAMIRPDPDSKNRPVFNVLHFLVGLFAQLTAVVTMFLGLYMTQLDLPSWCRAVMTAYVCFHAGVEITLAVHLHSDRLCPCKNKRGEKDYLLMGVTGGGQPDEAMKDSSGSRFKTFILAVHFCGVLGCFVAISVQIGLS